MQAAQTYWRRPTAIAPSQPTPLDSQTVAPLLATALRRAGLWRTEYLSTLSVHEPALLLTLLRAVMPEVTGDTEDEMLLAFGRLIVFSLDQGPIDTNRHIIAHLRGTSFDPAGLSLGVAATASLYLVRASILLGSAAVWPTRRMRPLVNASATRSPGKGTRPLVPRLLDSFAVGQLPL